MKIALVTGGTRGIGASTSKLMSKKYKVIANYNANKAAAESFTKETGIETISFDVADPKACSDAVSYVEKEFGQIEILVHCAGITRDAFLHKMSAEMFETVLKTNLFSCFYLSSCLIPKMRERSFGRLVFLSSINAVKGQIGQTNYSASKAGIIGFVKALALENASKGITVNAVAPGYTDTDMVRQINDEIKQKIIDQIPIKRLLTPTEIGRCVEFLISDESEAITGQVFHVNGGGY